MNRRDFVVAASAATLTGVLGAQALAEEAKHEHHDHGTPVKRGTSKELKELQDSTFNCLKGGELCLAQCNAVLAGGKTSMADCQLSVMNMLSVVDAMSKVAVYNTADAGQMKSLAKSCADFCRKCEKECKPHAEAHAECKTCMEACVSCYKACDAFVKAA